MATVTSYTAARMKQIEDAAIVAGHVAGDNLILTPKAFPTNPAGYPEVNAGNVRGPQGVKGDTGDVSAAQLKAAIPPGTMTMFAGDAAPAGYLLCDGAAVDRATYSELFAVLGTKYGAGNGTTTFNVPDMRSRMPAGKGPDSWSDTVGKKGGFKDSAVISHSHLGPTHQHTTPNHQHSIAAHVHDFSHSHPDVWSGDQNQNHQHLLNSLGTSAMLSNADHGHGVVGGAPFSNALTQAGAAVVGTANEGFTTSTNINHAHTVYGWTDPANVGHQHLVTTPTRYQNTGSAGSQVTPVNEGGSNTGAGGNLATETVGIAAADRNLSPYVIINFIIKI